MRFGGRGNLPAVFFFHSDARPCVTTSEERSGNY
jgi:hypothetical protein